jgi:signal transduction histidine kinase
MTTTATPLPRRPLRFGLGPGLGAAARGLALAAVALAGMVPLLLVILVAPSLIAFGFKILIVWRGQPEARALYFVLMVGAGVGLARFGIAGTFFGLRRAATLTRRLAGRWCGVPIADPYRPLPASRSELSFTRLLAGLTRDPATARDLAWGFVSLIAAPLVAASSAVIIGIGLIVFIGPELLKTIPPPAFPGNSAGTLIVLGLGIIAAGVLAAPLLLRGYGLLAGTMLAPAGRADLTRRLRHLAETRDEALDTSAAEIRRIERDLHDGAQARLVAMGMTLDAAGQIIDTRPEAARALLYEARDASVKALAELRDLVRGIHPPVLADRGLADAIRALALDTPVRIDLASDLASDSRGRLPAPVESAAYFAVSELLANVSKHAGARQAWVDIRHTDAMLRIGVTDNGHGGAEPARGTGLRGIERRLAAFDGVLAISSPPGGPTAVTMEIPCALSSPKTSSC